MNSQELTVSQVSALIKRNIEQNFSYVKIKGEVSGLKRAPSGHVYLSLKDQNSVLAAVCWRGIFDSLKIKPEEGMEVTCAGAITTYAGQSKYQLTIESFEHSGTGALMAMLEKRKQAFIAEGLFNPERKKKVPLLPRLIGVITSPTGSVIRDIIHRVSDRCPTDLLIWPVLVQGNEAAQQISSAIKGFNELKLKPDVIIVARGGGSIEDLWCFNEENVIRAVFASSIPIISAVGHETDTTLIDFVADLRAPTPTAAAELATPVLTDLKMTLTLFSSKLYSAMSRFLSEKELLINLLAKSIPTPVNFINLQSQKLDELAFTLEKKITSRLNASVQKLLRTTSQLKSPSYMLERYSFGLINITKLLRLGFTTLTTTKFAELNNLSKLLSSLSFENTLKRGFSIVRLKPENQIIRSTHQLKPGQAVEIELSDGKKDAVVG